MVWNTIRSTKISTKYCSHRCANLAYKKREREKNIKATEENTQNRIEELPIITVVGVSGRDGSCSFCAWAQPDVANRIANIIVKKLLFIFVTY